MRPVKACCLGVVARASVPLHSLTPSCPSPPAVYPGTGKVCISILHPPGEDKYGSELASERWRPILGVEAILISVISMLCDPNDSSPANVDAAVQWRNDNKGFRKTVRGIVRKTQDAM